MLTATLHRQRLWMRALPEALAMLAVTAFGEQPARLPAADHRVTATDAEGAGDIIVSDCLPAIAAIFK